MLNYAPPTHLNTAQLPPTPQFALLTYIGSLHGLYGSGLSEQSTGYLNTYLNSGGPISEQSGQAFNAA
jgi:hypothetical protein